MFHESGTTWSASVFLSLFDARYLKYYSQEASLIGVDLFSNRLQKYFHLELLPFSQIRAVGLVMIAAPVRVTTNAVCRALATSLATSLTTDGRRRRPAPRDRRRRPLLRDSSHTRLRRRRPPTPARGRKRNKIRGRRNRSPLRERNRPIVRRNNNANSRTSLLKMWNPGIWNPPTKAIPRHNCAWNYVRQIHTSPGTSSRNGQTINFTVSVEVK